MKNKKTIVLLLIVLLIILLFPIKMKYKDGGTKEYSAILYKVIVWNEINTNYENNIRTGTEIHLFPTNFHSIDYYRPIEPFTLFVTNENKEQIKAEIGSYCLTETRKKNSKSVCIDKLGPTEINYKEVLNTKENEKIFLSLGLSGITNIKIYNSDTKEQIKEKININKEESYITIPNIEGIYILSISYKYEEDNISYSFKVKVEGKNAN